MSSKDVVIPLMKHDVMVGRGKTIASKLIDAHTEMKLLLDDLVVPEPLIPTQHAMVPPTSGSGIVPKLCIILAVCLVCTSGGANYSTGGMTMAKAAKENPGPLLDGGKKAMLGKDWNTAYQLFTRAHDAGADADESYGRAAECCFYSGEYDNAKSICDALEKATNGKSPTPSYIRGLIAFQAKDYVTAREEFKLACLAGNPHALSMLKRIPQ